jgi:hypothetical protein
MKSQKHQRPVGRDSERQWVAPVDGCPSTTKTQISKDITSANPHRQAHLYATPPTVITEGFQGCMVKAETDNRPIANECPLVAVCPRNEGIRSRDSGSSFPFFLAWAGRLARIRRISRMDAAHTGERYATR